MTSELRPAVEVWRQAHQALYWLPKGAIGEQGAAAVIEADREAVRAEQAAEIERLKSHLEDAKEIIQKQIKQAAELAKFKALAETLAGALGPLRNAAEAVADSLNTAVMDGAIDKADKSLRQYKEARDD